MAEGAVRFLLARLAELLTEEANFLSGVRGQVREIKYELESMKAFLRDADAKEEMDARAKIWVTQVRDIVYDIEDLLDEFIFRLDERTHEHGWIGSLRKTARYVKYLKLRHLMATKVQVIRSRVPEISKRKDQYGFNNLEQGATSESTSQSWYDSRVVSLFIEEADLVGIDQPKHDLIKMLLDEESRLRAISVVGMGGLGKTTLTKKVYEAVKDEFECYAWITVTKLFKIEEIIRSMIKKFLETRGDQVPKWIDSLKMEELMETKHKYLQQKRYLIVFDDVWSTEAWMSLKCGLPDSNCGSRIMVTTRIIDVASSCIETHGHVYNLQPLAPEMAWKLFCRKAFHSQDENHCPRELEKFARDILLRCRGLPLAIAASGSLLFKKNKNVLEWERVHRNLGIELEFSDDLKHVNKILSLSYTDLPYYLKHCFLFFSNFPMNYLVKAMKLKRLWIAEGFVEEMVGRTMEEVAETYLNDLINRNLIEVAELCDSGRVRLCRVHDLVHEIILSKSREQNFSMFTTELNRVLLSNVRRLSIHHIDKNDLKNMRGLSHLRSLLIFGKVKFSDISEIQTRYTPRNFSESIYSNAFYHESYKQPYSNSLNLVTGGVEYFSISTMGSFFSCFRSLRVLDLDNVQIDIFPEEFGHLVFLRYLSLVNTRIKKIPKCLGKLKNLEVLNLKGTLVLELPDEFLQLENLRHLLVYHHDKQYNQPFQSSYGLNVPARIGRLTALQKLSVIEATGDEGIVRAVGNLTQLRRLAISKLRRKDGVDLCSSIEKMPHLLSFAATTTHENEFLDLQSVSSPLLLLQHLYLKGRMEKLPQWINSLENLVHLRLRYSRLREDPLRALQNLHKLVELTLTKAYDGEELHCNAGGYRGLKILRIHEMNGLKSMRVEEGGMLNLQEIGIACCSKLETMPLGMEHLIHLHTIYLMDMPVEYGEKILNHACVPHIICRYTPHCSSAYGMEFDEFPVEYRKRIVDEYFNKEIRRHYGRGQGRNRVETTMVDARHGSSFSGLHQPSTLGDSSKGPSRTLGDSSKGPSRNLDWI